MLWHYNCTLCNYEYGFFKNKLQSSEISVGSNSNKSQNNLDDLCRTFCTVNLNDDSSEKLISPKRNEEINQSSIVNNDYSEENNDKETLDLAKSLAEIFYKDLGINHEKIKHGENSKIDKFAETSQSKSIDYKSLDKITSLTHLPNQNKLISKFESNKKNCNNENSLKSLVSKHNLVFNVKTDVGSNDFQKNTLKKLQIPRIVTRTANQRFE